MKLVKIIFLPKAAMNILSGDLDQKTTDEILMQTINEKKTNC